MTDDRRTDHFAYLKHAPEAPPPERDQPVVTPGLVEHLEVLFPVTLPPPPNSREGIAMASYEVARMHGEQRVIAAIRELIRGA